LIFNSKFKNIKPFLKYLTNVKNFNELKQLPDFKHFDIL